MSPQICYRIDAAQLAAGSHDFHASHAFDPSHTLFINHASPHLTVDNLHHGADSNAIADFHLAGTGDISIS